MPFEKRWDGSVVDLLGIGVFFVIHQPKQSDFDDRVDVPEWFKQYFEITGSSIQSTKKKIEYKHQYFTIRVCAETSLSRRNLNVKNSGT